MSHSMKEEDVSHLSYTLITNVGYVDFHGARLWCHGVLIDKKPHKGMAGKGVRQIRGLTFYGIPAFTVWIEPDAKVEFKDAKTNMLIMSESNEPVRTGGVVIKAGEIELFAAADNYRAPLEFEDIEGHCPFGEECDDRFMKHTGGSYYPFVRYGPKVSGAVHR